MPYFIQVSYFVRLPDLLFIAGIFMCAHFTGTVLSSHFLQLCGGPWTQGSNLGISVINIPLSWIGRQGGTRTHTLLRALPPQSRASTSSATHRFKLVDWYQSICRKRHEQAPIIVPQLYFLLIYDGRSLQHRTAESSVLLPRATSLQ